MFAAVEEHWSFVTNLSLMVLEAVRNAMSLCMVRALLLLHLLAEGQGGQERGFTPLS